jgi:hypothetical protein
MRIRHIENTLGSRRDGPMYASRDWMRLTAVLRSVNRLTAVAPGRLFQMRTRRAAGHGSAPATGASRTWYSDGSISSTAKVFNRTEEAPTMSLTASPENLANYRPPYEET